MSGPALSISAQELEVAPRPRPVDGSAGAHEADDVARLAGGIAHDINNMLSAIRGFAVLAQAELAPDGPGKTEIDEVIAGADRAAALVRDLLTCTRPRASAVRLVSPGARASALEPMLRMLAGSSVELVLDDRSEGASVLADPGQLDQVLVNLAVNARDAMPGGGRLAIRTSRVAHADTVRIEVADTGAGIDAAVAARVFEPFYTTKRDTGGAGLGLANALDFVRAAGGTIGVQSARGAGTTVLIELPEAAE